MQTFDNIKKRFAELKAMRQRYVPRWENIAKYAGIRVQPQEYAAVGAQKEAEDLDVYTEDPTASLAVKQSADYLKGIMWGNGDNSISIEPSADILDIADKSSLDPWYKFCTRNLLDQMNHSNAGLNSALSAYFYDQNSYGTSGVGAFPNSSYGGGYETNVLLFRPYGVDTLCIDEGKNGLVEVVYNIYHWRVNRIVSEFCEKKSGFDNAMFEKLPGKVKSDYNNKAMNNTHEIIQAVVPREDFVPGALGKKGCKYIGYWFCEKEEKFFAEEDYKDMPIPVARAIKIRGEVYGRAPGTMLLSTIRCINEIVSNCMATMGKMLNPPIGILNTAVYGDNVVDTSENALTVFNAAMLAGQDPIFKMHDIGDPTPIVQFLLPYLNEKVATGFGIDILLDFAADANMTATESLQRYSIRGKAISGLVVQQKTELFEPLIRRCLSICMDKGVLGIDPADTELVDKMINSGRQYRIIPSAVIECIKEGKPWYTIKFNNEVDKIGKTEKIDNLLKLINIITAVMAIYPNISTAINWYKLLEDVSDSLGLKEHIISEKDFRAQIEQQAQQQRMMLEAQTQATNSEANKNNATAMREMSNG